MAFRNSTFYPLGNQSGRDHTPAKYIYRTDDTLAAVVAADYFTSIKSKLSMGDEIELQFVDFTSATDDTYTAERGRAKVVVAYNRNDILNIQEIDLNGSVLFGTMTDLSTAGTALGGGAATDGNLDLISNVAGQVVKITTILGGAITTGDAVITGGDQTTSVAFIGEDITVANAASAKGDVDSSTPFGANSVAVGDTIRLVSDGGSTVAQNLFVMMEIVGSSSGNNVYLHGQITDVSAVGRVYFASPIAGKVTKITTILAGVITAGDAAITSIIGGGAGTAITGGALTVANAGSAVGDVDTAFPTALNTVAVDDQIAVITDGGSTDAQKLDVILQISPS